MEVFIFGGKLLFVFIMAFSMLDRVCRCIEKCSATKHGATCFINAMGNDENIMNTEQKD